jgi:hypothetical integral membrane protein (TIGR02206 family)
VTPPFALFGPAHLGALAAVAFWTMAWIAAVRLAPEGPHEPLLRRPIAVALLALVAAEVAVAGAEGWLTREIALPLQLCDLNVLLAVVSLLTLDRRAAGILYFFALAGTLPAMLTPELPVGFPSFRFVVYFATHGLVVSSALTLVFGFRSVPARGAVARAFLALNLYAGAVALVNLALDTNYLYLRRKPSAATPFDLLGPWPYYLAGLEAAFLLVFFLLDLPLRRLREPRRASVTAAA